MNIIHILNTLVRVQILTKNGESTILGNPDQHPTSNEFENKAGLHTYII